MGGVGGEQGDSKASTVVEVATSAFKMQWSSDDHETVCGLDTAEHPCCSCKSNCILILLHYSTHIEVCDVISTCNRMTNKKNKQKKKTTTG